MLALAALSTRFDDDDLAGKRVDYHRRALKGHGCKSAEDVLGEIRRIEGYGPAADYLAERIVFAAHGLCAGVLDAATAWGAIARAAWMARSHYASWREWANGIGVGFEAMTDGRGNCWDEIEAQFANRESPWNTLPWDLDLLPPLQRFAVGIGAPVTAFDGGDARWFGGRAVTVAAVPEISERSRLLLRERYGLEDRPALVNMVQQMMHDPTDRALPLARIVAIAGYAARCGMLAEQDAWHTALVAAKVAQLTYASWETFGEALGEALAPIAGELAAGLWTELPWATDLQIVLA